MYYERRCSGVSFVCCVTFSALTQPAAGQQCPALTENASKVGQWGSLITPFFGPPPTGQVQSFPVHGILMKTGKLLIIPSEEIEENPTVVIYDHANGTLTEEFRAPTSPANEVHILPCSGHAALPDGRILFVGGTGDTEARTRATILDPDLITVDAQGNVTCDGCWIDQDDMPDIDGAGPKDSARFYPTCTAMPDGGILVLGGGSNTNGCPLVLLR